MSEDLGCTRPRPSAEHDGFLQYGGNGLLRNKTPDDARPASMCERLHPFRSQTEASNNRLGTLGHVNTISEIHV